MKRMALCLAALVIPALASGQDLDDQANINVTSTIPSYSGCDDPAFDSLEGNCLDTPTDRVAGAAFIWVVASRTGGYGNGIGGAQFGLNHDLAAQGWSLCTGGSEIPEGGWPASGTGNAVTWGGGCYMSSGEGAVIGYIAVGDGSVGNAAVIGDPRIGDLAVYADCDTETFEICDNGLGSLGEVVCECGPTPTAETSWGSIKSLF